MNRLKNPFGGSRPAPARDKPPMRFRNALTASFVTAIAITAAVTTAELAILRFPHLRPEQQITTSQFSDLVKNALAIVAGAGALIALVTTYRRQKTTEHADIREQTRIYNERFTTTASQLADPNPAIRIAGIYAMAGLADDWEHHRQTCLDVLCANLRTPHAPQPPPDAAPADHAAWQATREARHTLIRVITAHLQPDKGRAPAHADWSHLNLDFTGVTFDGGNFRGAQFNGTASFANAIFTDAVTFGEAQFAGGVNFVSAIFTGNADFHSAEFTGPTQFFGAQFKGHVYFGNAKFTGRIVNFTAAQFTDGSVGFDGAQFVGPSLSFEAAQFAGGTVRFNEAQFTGSRVSFGGAQFAAGTVGFGGAQFAAGTVSFDEAQFAGGTVSFDEAQFAGGTVSFDEAQFTGSRVGFGGAQFAAGTVSFEAAQFTGGTVDIHNPADWSTPPRFSFTGHPPGGLLLPYLSKDAST